MGNTRFVGDLSEDDLIRTYFAPIATDLDDDVARVVLANERDLLVSTDTLMEGVHFLRKSPARLIGEKAVRVNLSDIHASGGRPRWMTLSISLPKSLPLTWVQEFAEGVGEICSGAKVALIGGDTTGSLDRICISVTMMGTVARGKSVSRSGARVGDWIGVTGCLGESVIGLELILGKRRLGPEVCEHWLLRHFQPPDRGDFARGAAGIVTAMMDLSDGLAQDLPRLLRASGVRAELELAHMPLSPEARQIGLTEEAAFAAGEDYELLFTAPPKDWPNLRKVAEHHGVLVTKIGELHDGEGLRILKKGKPTNFNPNTWRHFD